MLYCTALYGPVLYCTGVLGKDVSKDSLLTMAELLVHRNTSLPASPSLAHGSSMRCLNVYSRVGRMSCVFAEMMSTML